ncbi:MAG: DUF1598 domain-containing protein [Planctomycetaceae bacterium]
MRRTNRLATRPGRKEAAKPILSGVLGAAMLFGGTVSSGFAAETNAGDQVAAHLAAGEFGPALNVALATEDAQQRIDLVARVAQAQSDAGQFDAARATLKKVSAAGVTGVAASGRPSQAGGLGADFTQLIDLIQNETGDEEYGPWLDVHGTGGTMSQFDSGVQVDPNGVLALVSQKDRAGRLNELAQSARSASLNQDMSQPSVLRMVSLTRLEAAIADRIAEGKPVVESMRQLAGLSLIQYVFVYPEDGEIVIAGPAEGWRYNEEGQPVGVESSRPTLQLDDLVTVLRTFSDEGMNVFGCSIDPKPENLAAMKAFAEQSVARGPLPNGGAGRWARQLGEKLGLQNVRVYGVPADSRVARVIIEADYRMKLIGLGKLDAGPEIPDYFEILADDPAQASGRIDGLRWWMTMQYGGVLHSQDRHAFEINGSAVKCLSENEFVGQQGQRVQTGAAEPTNRQFAANFTEHFSELASRQPIFADMHGIFDLAMVAALINHDRLDRQAGWDRGVFATDGAYLPASYDVPQEVETAVNHRVFRGNEVVVQVAGGVKGDFMTVLRNSEQRQTNAGLGGLAEEQKAAELPAGRWWWDAK